MKTLIESKDVSFLLPSLSVAGKTPIVLEGVTNELVHVTWFDLWRDDDFLITDNLISNCAQILPTPGGIRLYYHKHVTEYSEGFYVNTAQTPDVITRLIETVTTPLIFETPVVKTYVCFVHENIRLEKYRFLCNNALLALNNSDGLQFIVQESHLPFFEDALTSREFYYRRWYDVHLVNDVPPKWVLRTKDLFGYQPLFNDVFLSSCLHERYFGVT